MSSTTTGPDRCEVCRVVLHERPDPRRRRCADHLDQLALVPLARVPGRRNQRRATTTASTTTGTGGEKR